MSEIEEVGEQLSQEEISKEIEELIIALRPYNNLKTSVMHNKHHGVASVEADPRSLEGNTPDDIKFRNVVKRWEEYSDELRKGMVTVDLEPGHGYAYQDVRSRDGKRMIDLIFLREYYEKIKNLHEILSQKWDQSIMGTTFEGDKN
ncbi:MAG: hypothetical protein WC227_01645 [Patescibacteria group bacterium]|jgi:hypothetical protein